MPRWILLLCSLLLAAGCPTTTPPVDDDDSADDDDATPDDDDATPDDDDATPDDDDSADDDDATPDDDDATPDDDDSADDDDSVDDDDATECDAALDLDCDVVAEDVNATDSADSTDLWDLYSCSGLNYAGSEVIYRFTPASDDDYTFAISGTLANVDVVVLSSCDPDSCVGASSSVSVFQDEVTVSLNGGEDYYVVVDGRNGGQTAYTLSLTCGCLDDDHDGICNADDLCIGTDTWGDSDFDGYCEDVDCDDEAANTNPGASEYCDGEDNDCDGVVPPDEIDDDGDGVTECDGDCDDADPNNYPGNTEVCDSADNDCDGLWSPIEIDGDGDGVASCDGDCDDADPNNFPGNVELCDGVDNDCSGTSGEEETDDDGDGITECDGDCDDGDPNTYPAAPELCDELDNDCDTVVPGDELDADGDGFIACDGDCAAFDPLIHPDAIEVCGDVVDENCDGFAMDCPAVCGDGILAGGEEVDPPVSQFASLSVDPTTCRYDFTSVDQLVCGGTCSWGGADGCDQDDADLLCQLRTDNPGAAAGAFSVSAALEEGGFPCSADGFGAPFTADLSARMATPPGFDPGYMDTSIAADQGAVDVVTGVSCTTPCNPADYDGDGVSGCDGDCDDVDPSVFAGAPEICDDLIDQDCDGVDEPCTTCNNGVLDPGEEVDPPVSQFTTLTIDLETCRYDFAAAPQLYCNGSCTWDAAVSGCDQNDADIFCQLKVDNPLSTATSFTTTLALPVGGFPCSGLGYGTVFTADLVPRLANGPLSFNMSYQDTSVQADHGSGTVIDTTVCTDP